MTDTDRHSAMWEHRQAELWDRIFQVTQDVVVLAETIDESAGGSVMKNEMVKAAMDVGRHLVRANAAEDQRGFQDSVEEARMSAIETDYWLRLAYLLQQREEVQQDLSSIINQYSAIIDLLYKFARHASGEKQFSSRHLKGPRVGS